MYLGKSINKVLFFIFILYISFSAYGQSSDADNFFQLEKKVVEFFHYTTNFHTSVVSLIVDDVYFYPECYVVILKRLSGDEKVVHYFDINFYSEIYNPDYNPIKTVPYYSLRNYEMNIEVDFCFGFPLEESKNLPVINDSILKFYINGLISDKAQSYGFLKNASFFKPSYKFDRTIVIEFFLILLLIIVNILLVFAQLFNSNKNKVIIQQKRQASKEHYMEIAVEKSEKVKKSITDEITSLFTAEYLKKQIQYEIYKYSVLRKNFCIAFFVIQDKGDYNELIKVAEIIKENLRKNIISSYRGAGVFMSFFPEMREEEISIFVDLVVEKIDELNIPAVSRIHEYHGQTDFISGLGL